MPGSPTRYYNILERLGNGARNKERNQTVDGLEQPWGFMDLFWATVLRGTTQKRKDSCASRALPASTCPPRIRHVGASTAGPSQSEVTNRASLITSLSHFQPHSPHVSIWSLSSPLFKSLQCMANGVWSWHGEGGAYHHVLTSRRHSPPITWGCGERKRSVYSQPVDLNCVTLLTDESGSYGARPLHLNQRIEPEKSGFPDCSLIVPDCSHEFLAQHSANLEYRWCFSLNCKVFCWTWGPLWAALVSPCWNSHSRNRKILLEVKFGNQKF